MLNIWNVNRLNLNISINVWNEKYIEFEHKHQAGLLQQIQIIKWKWEVISMDFIIDLSKATKHHDAIMVEMDRLNKEAHFILVKSTYK